MRSEKNLNNNLLKKWWFWTIIAVSIIVIILLLVLFNIKPKFEISDFSINKDTTNYTSIENTTTYTGKGIITTQDKNNTYLVVIKQELKSGGSDTTKKIEYNTVLVSDGKGEFITYDCGTAKEIKKPNYDFEIISYLKFK